MGFLSRMHSARLQIEAAARILPHLNEIRRGGHASAAVLLEANADATPDGLALRYQGERFTWAELDVLANQWAHVLTGRGLARGDVVSLVMDNRPDYVGVLLGAAKLRAVTACINTNLTGAALVHAISIAKPRLVVAGTEHEASVRAALSEMTPAPRLMIRGESGAPASSPESADAVLRTASTSRIPYLKPNNDEPMAYLYTSGTTGLPKAAVVTNQRFMAAAHGFGNVLHQAVPGDVIYCALPLYHGTGQWAGFGASLTTGAALAIRKKFSASQFWSDVVEFEATHFVYIGELCRYLLQTPECPEERRHRVRSITGNGLRPDVWERFQRRFRIPLIREFYGATEGNVPLFNYEGRPGMLGRLGFGQAVLECDRETGAVKRDTKGRCVRNEEPGRTGLLVGRISFLATFDGYVDSKATESKILKDVFRKGDAWFNTGDLVTVHEDGWVSFADRVGDTFRWKGENVSTSEVALVLNAAPGVLESNVYGVLVPNQDGRAGMASLRVAEGFDLDAFARHVTSKLPRYARPLFIRMEEGIRVTSTFKHQKQDYQREGFDPNVVRVPLYVLQGERYEALDAKAYDEIRTGQRTAG